MDKLQKWLEDYKRWKRTPQNRLILDVTLVALATTVAALQRRESRGAHFRKDYPHQREEFRYSTRLTVDQILK